MTQNEMIEMLTRKCEVTQEEAKTALETANWNTLTATHLLEQEKFRRMQALNEAASAAEAMAVQFAPEESPAQEAQEESQTVADEAAPEFKAIPNENIAAAPRAASKKRSRNQGFRNVGEHIRRLVACGNRNSFTVRKGDTQLLDIPVTALAVLMLCAFWVCVPLLVVGLFAGCRYSFIGRDLGREDINHVLGKASDAAEHVKQSVAHA